MKILEDFRHLPEKRQQSITLSLVVIVLLVIVGVGANYLSNTYIDSTTEIIEENTETHDAPVEGIADDEQSIDEGFSQRQDKAIGGYSTDMKDMVDLLMNNIWVDASDEYRLEWNEKSVTQSGNGTSDEIRYVIVASKYERLLEATNANYFTAQYIAALETEDATYILEVSRRYSEDGYGSWRLKCEGLFTSDIYLPTEAEDFKFEIVGVDKELDKVIDGKSEELGEELTAYCEQYYPASSTATWDGKANVDYENGLVSLTFTLNSHAKTRVSVAYNMQDEKFEIGRTV